MNARARAARFRELRVVTAASWLARDLAAAGVLPVVGDLGLDVPADVADVAWWCSGGFAARLAASGVHVPFLGPSAAWQGAIPADVMGREVHSASLGQAAAALASCTSGVFAKVADVKLSSLPARWWDSGEQFVAAAAAAGVPATTPVLWTPTRVQFVREFRCFVAHRSVTAASLYIEDGHTWDAWESGTQPPAGHAVGFAEQVLAELSDQPPAWVLDVGQTANGDWQVVEGNPAWCANPYHCDPAGVIEAVLTSQDSDPGLTAWRWTPGEVFSARARPLPVRRT